MEIKINIWNWNLALALYISNKEIMSMWSWVNYIKLVYFMRKLFTFLLHTIVFISVEGGEHFYYKQENRQKCINFLFVCTSQLL